jgi:TolA-binding protein
VSVVDVHPEDLLDREARGTLSLDESRHLQAHLLSCAACRMERQLRADVARELGVCGASVQDFVTGALLAARTVEKPVVTTTLATPPTRGFGRRRAALVFAATLILGSGLAAAQPGFAAQVVIVVRRAITGFTAEESREQPARHEHASAHVLRKDKLAPAPAAREVALPAVSPTREVLDSAQAIDTGLPSEVSDALPSDEPMSERLSRHATRRARRHQREARQRAHDTRVASTHDARSPEVGAPAVLPIPPAAPDAPAADGAGVAAATLTAPIPSSPASLFEQANQARRKGKLLEATQLYRELATRFEHSPEARLSLVVVGRLELDHGDPENALRAFRGYLSLGDRALREEALVGRTQALHRLGRTDEERDSLRELLKAYPDSSYGRLAREREERTEP